MEKDRNAVGVVMVGVVPVGVVTVGVVPVCVVAVGVATVCGCSWCGCSGCGHGGCGCSGCGGERFISGTDVVGLGRVRVGILQRQQAECVSAAGELQEEVFICLHRTQRPVCVRGSQRREEDCSESHGSRHAAAFHTSDTTPHTSHSLTTLPAWNTTSTPTWRSYGGLN